MFTEINFSKIEPTISPKFVVEDEKYKPNYANDTDYCMDVKVKIKKRNVWNTETFEFTETDSDYDIIAPNDCKTFGTGLKASIPKGWGLFIAPRSSTGFKLKCELANTLGIIDSGYRDEIKMCIHNFGTEPVMLEDGQRICQMYMQPRYKMTPEYVEDNDAFREGDRGGGIGSTGV